MQYTATSEFPGNLTDEEPQATSLDDRLANLVGPMAVDQASPLSYSHNGPSIEIATNGTYTKLNIPGAKDKQTRPKRGRIDNFTPKSRRRMMDKLNQVDQAKLAPHKYFTTLTYADFDHDRRKWNAHRRAFEKRIKRRYDIQAMVWKLEPQKRLAPHFHYLIFAHEEIDNDELAQCWHDIAGQNNPDHLAWHRGDLGNGNKPCTTKIEYFDGVKSYVSKYCSKEIEGDTLPAWWRGGRFWGGMQDLPITIETVEITPREAFDIRRVMRKLYESKTKKIYKTRGIQGVKLYCKPDTTQRLIIWASNREQQRTEEQPPIEHYRKQAALGIKYTGYGYTTHTPNKHQAEQEYYDRLQYYGRKEIKPEDCRTLLEKYGFTGLEQRMT